MKARRPTPRRRDDRQTLREKIGVGIVTGLGVGALTWAVWTLITLPHQVELHEYVLRWRGLWLP